MRDEDSVDAGSARVSPAGDRRGRPDAAGLLHERAGPTATSMPAFARRSNGCSSARIFCFGSKPIPTSVARAPPIASPTSNWPRACRSSCGAASRTTSCSTWRFAGKLRDPAVLDQQARRMLADPRARAALVDNFFGQWLQTRNVWLLTPDANRKFPWFDDNLRTAFVQGDRAVPRRSAEGGPQHRGSADGERHVPERTAGRGTTAFPASTAATSGG